MDDFLDEAFVDEAETFKELDSEDLHSVSMLAQKQVEMEQELADMEKRVKEFKKELFILSSETIPERMLELGISGFEMDSGEKLSVIREVTASISQKNKEAAHKWLDEQGHGDIIKHTVTAKFARGEDDKAKKVVEDLNENGIDVDVKQAVHAMTLKAFVKEQLEKGNEIDRELLGVFEYSKTKITKKR